MCRDLTVIGTPSVTIATVILVSTLVSGQVTINPTAPVNASFDSGLDDKTRSLLVDSTNEYRREERQASNMNRIDWATYLEWEATQWVARCEFKHQEDRAWGENMYRSTFKTTAENTISNALLAWQLEQYNMISFAGGVDCCSAKKKTCCHYTQLVWANTEYMGCAMNECPVLKGETSDMDFMNAIFLVCYYYPPGNVLKQQPYLMGKGQCSDCAPTNPDCDNGLCYFDSEFVVRVENDRFPYILD